MSTHLAPMPTHGATGHSLWRSLWNAYEPVITALRRIPLVTDVETMGGMFGITTQLTDGSHLWISSDEELPLDPATLQGFLVKRAHEDNPTIDEIVYNSTPDGADAEYGNDLTPLLQAITEFVTARRLAPRLLDLLAVHTQGVTPRHRPLAFMQNGPFSNRDEAIKEYSYIVQLLAQRDWLCVHTQGGAEWPLTVWEFNGEIMTVFLGRLGQELA
ncbi:hypothetical protein ACFWXK_14120 [Streptomyces sp. NPDC059070]|uniref:hypothetical protein n=1 Tax=Streptomyces sp. NPDC059070 TaxID=3346713 RepID=UPI0036BFC56D